MRKRSFAYGLCLYSALVGFAAIPSANAQTFTVLHRFKGNPTDGATPYAGLISDSAGNLYGTTIGGGGQAPGTVFKIDKNGRETILYSFLGGTDGLEPYAELVRDAAGNLYGTTFFGGGSVACPDGCGTVFEVNAAGQETVLHAFSGGTDGSHPYAGLVRDSSGNLYGTTETGGANDLGTVFEVASGGTETLLYSFAGGTDGATPYAGLIRDSAGNLYGTTTDGGALGFGTVFDVSSGGTETVLYSFAGGIDGAYPGAGLIRDPHGNLYGTTNSGGAFGFGTAFELDTTGKETILHSFAGGTDGEYTSAGLIRDTAGNFYGTTYDGGAFGSGIVFRLSTTGEETILHAFSGGRGGTGPLAGLVRDAAGNLYGTTYMGGLTLCSTGGCGTVFKLKP